MKHAVTPAGGPVPLDATILAAAAKQAAAVARVDSELPGKYIDAAVGTLHGAIGAFVLREFGMNALIMLALRVQGEPWGLVELYEMRLRRFSEDEIAVAQFLTAHAEQRLAVVGTRTPLRPWPRVYELPSEGGAPRGPRTR